MKSQINRLLTGSLLVLTTILLTGCSGPNLFDRFGNLWSYGICSTIIVILDIVALVEILGGDRPKGDKILWSLFIIFAPVVGCLVYFFLSRDKKKKK